MFYLLPFDFMQDAYRLQLKLFLYEVKQQQLLSGVRTFLKVYSTISLGKLANYMEVDEPTLRSTFIFSSSGFFVFVSIVCLSCCTSCFLCYRTILLTYKHKTHAVDSDGKIISNADVDFYIDDVGFIFSLCMYIQASNRMWPKLPCLILELLSSRYR